MRVKIHREGLNILVVLLFILLVINIPAWLFMRPVAIPVTFTVISAVVYLLVLNFFRSPRRSFKGNRDNVVVASADGKVVALEETYEDEFLHCRCIQLSVFMSVLNVHANWFPIDGYVTRVEHQDGNYHKAWLPKASLENEHSMVIIRTSSDEEIMVRQVAGALARRIVTYAKENEECYIDEHMGFIKFGSRVDVFLPLDAEVEVKLGQSTTGNQTVIARLKS